MQERESSSSSSRGGGRTGEYRRIVWFLSNLVDPPSPSHPLCISLLWLTLLGSVDSQGLPGSNHCFCQEQDY